MSKSVKKVVSKKGASNSEDVDAKINEILQDGAMTGENKMEVDYSQAAEEKIPEAQKLAAAGKLDAALELLLALEKQTRTGGDMKSTAKVLVCIVQICFKCKNWALLNEQIILLSKKRAQLKAAVTKMVQECSRWLLPKTDEDKKEKESIPSRDIELKLIETLLSITEGKIYVECERARLTHRLSKMKEEDGKVEEGAKIMQELQVETYGSMERKEKVELILEQMRLCLATKDYIRTQIISKKINTRFFEAADNELLKLVFYEYMIELDQNEGTYINVCKHYRACYNTPCIKSDPAKRLMALKHVALYILLSPFDNEQSDLIHRILEDKALDEIPTYKSLLEQFTNMELIEQARLSELYERDLKEGAPADPPTNVFNASEAGVKRWTDLKNRVVEHNIRIMAKYYTRITLKRMAELLALSENEAEEFLSTMVVKGSIEAKTDRLDGIVNFRKQQRPNELLNDWSHNCNDLMLLVQKTTHLINKEEMVHKHLMAGGKD